MDLSAKIDAAWNAKTGKMDWPGMEQALVEALHEPLATDREKVAMCKEIIDAFTGRGHFKPQEYQ